MIAIERMRIAGFPLCGLIHVGANEGQERLDYARCAMNPCIYVEPIMTVFQRLLSNIDGMAGHTGINAVCSDKAGEIIFFNIASNDGLSSSMLPLGEHLRFHPTIVYTSSQKMITTTVDKILSERKMQPNLLIVDTQGADLKVLQGAKRSLKDVFDGVFVEVSIAPLYEGGCSFEEISSFLKLQGYEMAWMSLNESGHGDAFYARKEPTVFESYDGNKALHKAARQSSFSAFSRDNDADGAVNGIKNGTYSFHTDVEDCPWWTVDLESIIKINEIRIFNRVDVSHERSRTLMVWASDDGEIWRLIHNQEGKPFGGIKGRPLRVMGDGLETRFVKLQLAQKNALHLDQVEIY